MRLERKVLVIVSIIAFGVDFLYLVARNALQDGAGPSADLFHLVLMLIGAAALTVYALRIRGHAEHNPLRVIGIVVGIATGLLLLLGLLQLSTGTEFVMTGKGFGPRNVVSVLVAILIGITALAGGIFMSVSLAELIFVKRRRKTRRNFVLLLSITALYAVLAAFIDPSLDGDTPWHVTLLFVVMLAIMLVNTFRFSWILVLSRREKLFNLLLSFFGFVFFTMLATDITVLTSDPLSGGLLHHAVRYYHPLVWATVSSVCLFGALYMGIGFASTLLHLPTAKEFDRKKVEISSLQNMGRLVTQVFDFEELVGTSTALALDVCEANAAWLELAIPDTQVAGSTDAHLALTSEATADAGFDVISESLRGITIDQIMRMRMDGGQHLRELVAETARAIVIQDVQADRRLNAAQLHTIGIGSLALVPLLSHDRLIGILGVVKKNPYEFDKDVLTVLYAFADMVSIALENSRLIEESLRRERFQQEIRVAQDMQRSLLPVLLPVADTYALAATSLPAYEVGGDYYDVVQLDNDRLGITIGDVSGKGVSAALYMAQVKGIFQTLSSHGLSTRESLMAMNETLRKNMDRRSFISLIYGVLDIRTGHLRFSRAGHCPLLYISRQTVRFLRPDGMGLGLSGTEQFASSLKEEEVQLEPGDVMVLYTDGITEAKTRSGDEFGTDRLAHIVEQLQHESVETIMTSIVKTVKEYTGAGEAEDDMTVMVLRWDGAASGASDPASGGRDAHAHGIGQPQQEGAAA